MQDLFKKALSKVKWNMETSEMFDNIYGVLQGGVISPSLFKLYIDDLCQYLGGSTGVTVGGTLVKPLAFRRRPRADVGNQYRITTLGT